MMAYRLGWFLYWVCLALIAGWVLTICAIMGEGSSSGLVHEFAVEPLATAAIIVIPSLLLYGLGRGLRYVLSGSEKRGGAIRTFFDARQDRSELAQLRLMLGSITEFMGTQDLTLMIRTGSRIRQSIEKRFGSEDRTSINDDGDLLREERIIETLPPERLFALSHRLSLLANKAGAEEEHDLAPTISPRLLSGWLKAKAIARRSGDAKVVKEAREHEDLYFFHIKSLLRIVRGEDPLGAS